MKEKTKTKKEECMYYGSIGRNKHKCVTNEYRLHKQTIERTEQNRNKIK